MGNSDVGNLDVIVTKAISGNCLRKVKAKITSLHDPNSTFQIQNSDALRVQQKFEFKKVPIGHYKIEIFCDGYYTKDGLVHLKLPGGDTDWKGHFRKARNTVHLTIQKKAEHNAIARMSEGTRSAIKSIIQNPNLSSEQKIQLIRNLPENIRDPKINNPYLTHDFDLTNFPMDKIIENLVIPADETIRSIPPGQSTGHPQVDTALQLYQLLRDLWEKARSKASK